MATDAVAFHTLPEVAQVVEHPKDLPTHEWVVGHTRAEASQAQEGQMDLDAWASEEEMSVAVAAPVAENYWEDNPVHLDVD